MICYKDCTWCPFFKNCLDGENCSRALTDKVIEGAEKWWGKKGAPIDQFSEEPECFRTSKSVMKRLKHTENK